MSVSEEIRATARSGGEKGRKAERASLIPTDIIMEVAAHYHIGSQKYDDHNWRKGYPWSWSYDALQRHLAAFWQGQDRDEETGSRHIIAALWHVIALAWFSKYRNSYDDRWKE